MGVRLPSLPSNLMGVRLPSMGLVFPWRFAFENPRGYTLLPHNPAKRVVWGAMEPRVRCKGLSGIKPPISENSENKPGKASFLVGSGKKRRLLLSFRSLPAKIVVFKDIRSLPAGRQAGLFGSCFRYRVAGFFATRQRKHIKNKNQASPPACRQAGCGCP